MVFFKTKHESIFYFEKGETSIRLRRKVKAKHYNFRIKIKS